MPKVTHVTSVHQRGDTRIAIKECATLSDAGFDVSLIVADGKGGGSVGNVAVRDVGGSSGRFARATSTALRVRREVVLCGARICHFHDPELIPVAMSLKARGIRVIYDVHEDMPRQIMSKHWIPSWARSVVSAGAEGAEWVAGRTFDGVVTATPTISARFPVHKTVIVQNFPILRELYASDNVPMRERPVQAAYVGGITCIRGAKEMIMALGALPERYGLRLALCGRCAPASLRNELVALPGWQHVEELGWIDRKAVASALAGSRMGLVLFHPAPNHMDAQPNKMFEYMSAGVPVIASDFPLWRKIIDGAGCGLLVDPHDPHAIADAMRWLLDHPEEADAMGRCGREAVEQLYNWETESQKLLSLYGRLLDMPELGRRGNA